MQCQLLALINGLLLLLYLAKARRLDPLSAIQDDKAYVVKARRLDSSVTIQDDDKAALWNACTASDPSGILRIVAKYTSQAGSSANQTDLGNIFNFQNFPELNTPLIVTVQASCSACVFALAGGGVANLVDVNLANANSNTPLSLAVSSNSFETVRALLNLPSIDVNAPGNLMGFTPLMLATVTSKLRCGSREEAPNLLRCKLRGRIVRLLLLHPNINVNAQNSRGESAFYLAAQQGDLGLALVLLSSSKRVDILLTANDGSTAFSVIPTFKMESARVAALLQLMYGYLGEALPTLANPAPTPAPSTPPVDDTVESTVATVALRIAQLSQTCSANDGAVLGAILQSVKDNYFELASRVLNYKILQEDGISIFHVAARKGSMMCLQLLADTQSVLINAKTNSGWTALSFAVFYQRLDAVTYLLSLPHIDVNQSDLHGFTALHWAVIKSNQAVINLLIDAAITVNTVTDSGSTAYDFARSQPIRALLKARGGVTGISLQSSSLRGNRRPL